VVKINCDKYDEIHCLLNLWDNKLLFEKYFQGYKWDGVNHGREWTIWEKLTPHGIKSISKSITSLSIGIAIEQGFNKCVELYIFDH
jgi:CubicO group peptidase (beta-lactamase class C family)